MGQGHKGVRDERAIASKTGSVKMFNNLIAEFTDNLSFHIPLIISRLPLPFDKLTMRQHLNMLSVLKAINIFIVKPLIGSLRRHINDSLDINEVLIIYLCLKCY